MTPQQYGPLIGLAIALPLILFRNRKPRALHPERMWIVPLIVLPLIGLGLWASVAAPGAAHMSLQPSTWLVLGLGLFLGGLLGWWRGRMTTIERHTDGTLKAKASPIGLILIVAILIGRRALSAWLEPHAIELGVDPLAMTDAFLLLAVGMIVMQRIEMFIRARRIQAGHPDDHVAPVA